MESESAQGIRQPVLHYVHDPMCSWCWAFRPRWDELVKALPEWIPTRLWLGGLAPETEAPMPVPMQRRIRSIWRTIEREVPGTRFNFAFWERCRPRRSTHPACRAVIAARIQEPDREDSMILAIQQAYYLEARNPSDRSTLVELAETLGLDTVRFAADLDCAQTRHRLEKEISFARSMGVRQFPSLVLETAAGFEPIPVDYKDTAPLLQQIKQRCTSP